MIDPIHQQAYQDYTRISRQKPQHTSTENLSEEKFSMENSLHGNSASDSLSDGVIYEPAQKKEEKAAKTDVSDNFKPDSQAPSSSGKSASDLPARTQKTAAADSGSIFAVIRRLFQNMIQTAKKVLTAIWESNPPKQPTTALSETDADPAAEADQKASPVQAAAPYGASDQNAAPVMEPLSDTAPADRLDQDIKNALKAGNTDEFRALLSEDGQRIPAKNSSLLTYYDSKGNLVNLDPSDQYRILHGDRGSQKS